MYNGCLFILHYWKQANGILITNAYLVSECFQNNHPRVYQQDISIALWWLYKIILQPWHYNHNAHSWPVGVYYQLSYNTDLKNYYKFLEGYMVQIYKVIGMLIDNIIYDVTSANEHGG